jgi:hypothetical protein
LGGAAGGVMRLGAISGPDPRAGDRAWTGSSAESSSSSSGAARGRRRPHGRRGEGGSRRSGRTTRLGFAPQGRRFRAGRNEAVLGALAPGLEPAAQRRP